VTDLKEIDIESVQPSQLYISELKYQAAKEDFEIYGWDSYKPVPVKRIGKDVFFTDGHTRALLLWQKGYNKIKVTPDTDDMDWISYLASVQWCRRAGIRSIRDLSERIVSEQEYQAKWLALCEKLHTQHRENPILNVKIGIVTSAGEKSGICGEILRELPEWFGIDSAVENYVREVAGNIFYIAVLYEKTIGFCAVKTHFGNNAELYVLGIFPEFHRKGIGKVIIDKVAEDCKRNGIRYLTVKTLSERHSDKNYRKTREFYKRVGFIPLEEFQSLWDESNPCLYMIKEL
jgi:ribosomal protein S18 acetylase RimI-like enzyme